MSISIFVKRLKNAQKLNFIYKLMVKFAICFRSLQIHQKSCISCIKKTENADIERQDKRSIILTWLFVIPEFLVLNLHVLLPKFCSKS